MPINLSPDLDGPFVILGVVGTNTEAGQTILQTKTSATTLDGVQWHYEGSSCSGAYASLDSGYTALISAYGNGGQGAACDSIDQIIQTSGYFPPLTSTPDDQSQLDWFQKFVEPLFRGVVNTL